MKTRRVSHVSRGFPQEKLLPKEPGKEVKIQPILSFPLQTWVIAVPTRPALQLEHILYILPPPVGASECFGFMSPDFEILVY